MNQNGKCRETTTRSRRNWKSKSRNSKAFPTSAALQEEIERLRQQLVALRQKVSGPFARGLGPRPSGPPSATPLYPRLYPDALHGFSGIAWRPPFCRRRRDGRGLCAVRRPPRRGHREPEGSRHQAEAAAQFRHGQSGGLSQGAAGDGTGLQIRPARSSALSIPRAHIPGIGAEERGQAEAIAYNLKEICKLRVPIVVLIHGEGGSGGALAIAVGDEVLMHENSIYSVISPESCSSILVARLGPQARSGARAEDDGGGPLSHADCRSGRAGAHGRRAHRPRAGGGTPAAGLAELPRTAWQNCRWPIS